MDIQTYTLTWHDGIADIEIRLTFKPRHYQEIAHLEIESINPDRAPLPITETGYRSHFFHTGTIDLSDFDPVTEVRNWIEKEAASPKWQKMILADRQMSLF